MDWMVSRHLSRGWHLLLFFSWFVVCFQIDFLQASQQPCRRKRRKNTDPSLITIKLPHLCLTLKLPLHLRWSHMRSLHAHKHVGMHACMHTCKETLQLALFPSSSFRTSQWIIRQPKWPDKKGQWIGFSELVLRKCFSFLSLNEKSHARSQAKWHLRSMFDTAQFYCALDPELQGVAWDKSLTPMKCHHNNDKNIFCFIQNMTGRKWLTRSIRV